MKRKDFEKICKQCHYYKVEISKHANVPRCLKKSKHSHVHSRNKNGLTLYQVYSKICEDVYNGEKFEGCPEFLNGLEEYIMNKEW